MSASYALRRIAFFFVVIWITATANFLLVRAAPGDPISNQVARMSATGQAFTGGPELIAEYKRQFGLDKPVLEQYLSYLSQLAHFNLGYSITNFPTEVSTVIGDALPWTLGLLTVTTVFAFAVGSLLGALMVWRASPGVARFALPGVMVLAAIPYYLLAVGLLYVFAYRTNLLPVSGAGDILRTEGSALANAADIFRHSLLPALSVVLSALGFWMLWMRSMMISVLGSDYLLLAEAKGLKERRIFLRYAVRTAILPQVTMLAISLGNVVSGVILVEVIFAYPGLGQLLLNAINSRDYPLIQGISLMLVVTVAGAMLILDLLYPRIDPRITYERR